MLKITACAIVKNEEENLPRWLECVKLLANEIVVVDTGSTDRTVELAKEAGARVYSFAWRQDFSAAKNFALQKAKGDWIVFLDADEYFREEDIPKVKAHIKTFDKEARTAGFMCPWVNIDADRGNAIMFESVQLRVFRRHPDIRYHGAIHEMLETRNDKWRVVTVDDVRIWHTGYSASVLHRKMTRNLEILLKERERRGELWSDAFYLADCYHGLKRYEEAIEWAKKAIASEYTLVGLEKRPYDVLLGSMLELDYPSTEICEAARQALEKFPDSPDYKADEGSALWMEKDYAEAEVRFNEALAMTSVGSGHVRAVILGYLADIARRKGQDARALDYATEALKEVRFSVFALSQLCKIVKSLPAADVIQFLNTIYDASADAEFLIHILAKNGLHEVCLYYDKKSGGRFLSEWERLFFAKAFRAAVCQAADGMTRRCAMAWLAAKRTGKENKMNDILPNAFQASENDGKTSVKLDLQTYLAQLEQVFPAETSKTS
ncbi:MAG: glycosyltransferase [Schwartzia sp.]|nr:glycosyltransferase [Schwartzia sp. (in: firmicutes)]